MEKKLLTLDFLDIFHLMGALQSLGIFEDEIFSTNLESYLSTIGEVVTGNSTILFIG